ncbi:MAG: hypothetical protein HY737_03965 [Candidatus Omnitrophica bacterium]|nr:hypothetical protein [Candidatus Omnitrophota bacterium]
MDWNQLMLEPLRLLAEQLQMLIPKMLGALLILVAGWLLGGIARGLIVRLLRAIGLERLAEKAKISELLHRGAIRLTFVELLGQLVYWLLLVAATIVGLQFVGIDAAAEWLTRFGAFLPRIIVGIVVFLFGMLLASFLGATVRAATLNAGLTHGHLVGQAVYTMVLLVTIIVALEQLQVVTRTIEIALYILMGTFGLAFALALGLGSQGLVKRFLEDIQWEKRKSSKGP